MAASAETLRAYLEWQAEMGTEEVILPAPLRRAVAAQGNRGDTPGSKDARGFAAGGSGASLGGEARPGSGSPERRSPGGSPDQAGSGFPAAGAPSGLYQSLSQALQESERPAVAATPSRAVRTDASPLPAFAGLPDLWEHLEKNPHAVLGLDAAEAREKAGVTRVVRGAGPAEAPLALVGLEPSEADTAEGKPFRGEAGALLEKMMRAIRMDMTGLYATNLIKTRTAAKASRRELARILPWLHAELGLARPGVVVLLGEACAQAVLKTGKTLDELRQEPHRIEGREFVATYHPNDLLLKEELKRKAWEDLQWLQRRMSESGGRP